MTPWLTIIGMGVEGASGISGAAQASLESAEIVLGPDRLLATLGEGKAEQHAWGSPLSDSLERLEDWHGRKVCILATGDPMHYGIGATLARRFPIEEMVIHPSPSAFSLTAARMGWALQDCETLSLHGRPAARLSGFLEPGAKLIALTSGAETIGEAAEILVARGFGSSIVTVLENMGAEEERIVSLPAEKLGSETFGPFQTLAIHCLASESAAVLPRVPGLPDDAFEHDGQLTKREVRAATLAALGPTPGALLWDVGAGCGSVGIEWMRAERRATAIAFERHEGRLAMIVRNAEALGVPELEIVAGELPDCLVEQPTPSAIFLGGAVSNASVFEACWNALPTGGTMVANAVTLEGESALAGYHDAHGGELVRMEVSRLEAVGSMRGMRPSMAVTQWRVVK